MRYGSEGVGSGHRMAARFQALTSANDQTGYHQPTEAEVAVPALAHTSTLDTTLDTAPNPDVAKPAVGRRAQLIPLWVSWLLSRLVRLRTRPIPEIA